MSTEPLTGRRGERAAGGALARESGVLNEFGRVRLHATRPSIARLNRPQTAAVLSRGPIAGVQFYPLAVAGTRVGPVSGRGGMVRDVAPERLSVIIGRGTSLRDLARVLLPLWNTATPFTPSGSAAPLPLVPLSVDELARGLLVYNRYYLPVPAMTAWNFGLRFPLPVEIDRDSGEGVIHPEIIRRLAGTFDLAWEPLLDRFPAAPVSPAAADLDRAVATFLAAHPENYARGIHLATRVVTNALAEREFVLAVLGRAGDAFELALSFVDALVVHQVSLLASTRAGADVLDRIRALLGANTGTVSERQRARLDRATGMLARTAGAVARPAPYVLPDATRPLDLRRQTDITLFAMNLFAEAGFEIAHYGLNSIRAVAQVVLNRVRCGYAGTPRDVILAHAQFSWTLATSPVHDLPFTPVRNPRNEPIWLDCLDVAAAALGGTMANPGVDNADSYYNPAAASPAWGTPATFVVRIGNHNFHRLRCPAP